MSDIDDIINPSLGTKVDEWAQGKLGQMVGKGECFDLAEEALRAVGAKSAKDYDPKLQDQNYKWGTETTQLLAQKGDIIQFKDVQLDGSDGSQQTFPHHTAIIHSVDGSGKFTILEQNGVGGRKVCLTKIDLSTKTKGSFWIYRPQPK